MGPSVENGLQGHSLSEWPLLISGLMIWVTTGELTMRKAGHWDWSAGAAGRSRGNEVRPP